MSEERVESISQEVSAYALVADVLAQVRTELDDHREAINENTSEISLSQEMVNEVHRRLDTITARIDELTLLIKGKSSVHNWKIEPLSQREKTVFQALYALCHQRNNAVTYKELAKRLKSRESSVSSFVSSFVAKGIPVVKRYSGGRAFVGLDEAFQEAQAKNNIVGVNTLLTYWDSE